MRCRCTDVDGWWCEESSVRDSLLRCVSVGRPSRARATDDIAPVCRQKSVDFFVATIARPSLSCSMLSCACRTSMSYGVTPNRGQRQRRRRRASRARSNPNIRLNIVFHVDVCFVGAIDTVDADDNAMRRAADGTYSAIENVDVARHARVRASNLSLNDNRLRTLDGLEFCTNLRVLDVRVFVSVSRALSLFAARCSR